MFKAEVRKAGLDPTRTPYGLVHNKWRLQNLLCPRDGGSPSVAALWGLFADLLHHHRAGPVQILI